MNLRPYPEYKDSGVEWVEKIPKNWQIHRINRLGSLSTSSVDKKSSPDEIEIKLVNYMDVYKSLDKKIDSSINFMNVTAKPQQLINNNLLRGDVLFTPSSETSDDIGNSAVVFEDLKNTLHSYHLIRLRFNKEIELKLDYKRYLFNNHFTLNQFSSKCVGITRMILGIPGFGESYSLIPPIKEQKQIASFLDKKTSEIDKTIEKDTRLIGLLQEKRSALINHMVTKGLDPEKPMKYSGIEWIGEIPKGWEVRKFSHFINLITKGATPTSYGFKFQDEGINFIKIESINENGEFIPRKFAHISEDCDKFLARSKIRVNDLLFSIAGALGRVAIVNESILPANTNQALAIIRVNEKRMDIDYLFYNLKSNYINQYINENAVQSAQSNLSMESIQYFRIIVPPKEEQRKIVEYLDKKTSKIDKTIQKIQKNITLLQEYKKSLIDHVVTGKVDVRDVV